VRLTDEQLQQLRELWRAVEQKRAREEEARALVHTLTTSLRDEDDSPLLVAQRALRHAATATNHAVDEYHEALVDALTTAPAGAGSPS
jgi:hypothetical protein